MMEEYYYFGDDNREGIYLNNKKYPHKSWPELVKKAKEYEATGGNYWAYVTAHRPMLDEYYNIIHARSKPKTILDDFKNDIGNRGWHIAAWIVADLTALLGLFLLSWMGYT